MKAILFFVAAGVVLPRHQDAAKAIADKTGKRVVFRNSSVAESEKPEANEGVAGAVPENYKAFTQYGDKGATTSKGDANVTNRDPGILKTDATTPAGTGERKLNALGVPDEDDAPTDRDGLKGILTEQGIEFHGNAKTETLVALYNEHFYPQG